MVCGWDALFDTLKVAYDTNADDAITSADDIVIDEDFSATTVSPTHDDATGRSSLRHEIG